MRGTVVTARRALLAVVVLALVATVVSWYCCDHTTTVGGGRGTAADAVVLAAAHHADACDDGSAPLVAAEPGRSPLARPAVTLVSGVLETGAGAVGVAGASPDAARGDPPSPYALCVLRT